MLHHQLTRCEPGYVFNCKSDPEDKNSALLIVSHTPTVPLTTAILATSRPVGEVDLLPFLNSARNASINPMILPTALADLVISSEAYGTVSIDSKLSQLEKGNDSLLESASMVPTTIDSAERTAKTLNTVRGAIGRSERRLQSLKYLLHASLDYMQGGSHSNATAAQSSPQWDVDAAQRILRAHNANMRSDVEHLLLQVWNNNVRVQTQQQVVSPSDKTIPICLPRRSADWFDEQVYNFMTTREAISGRMIAAAGMKDGAAMKALALLTTVFLPGTFLAVRIPSSPRPASPLNRVTADVCRRSLRCR